MSLSLVGIRVRFVPKILLAISMFEFVLFMNSVDSLKMETRVVATLRDCYQWSSWQHPIV